MPRSPGLLLLLLLASSLLACEGPVERPLPPPHDGVYSFAGGCYTLDATEPGSTDTRWLAATPSGEGFAFSARAPSGGARFFLQAADLGTYLFYDEARRYLVADDEGALSRQDTLLSDVMLVDDAYVSGAEWALEISAHDPARLQLRNLRTGRYLAREGLAASEAGAAVVALYPAEGCAAHPELTVDAEGTVTPRAFDDGSVFGMVDTHSHVLSNFGFGGGGIFHGAPFHRLGVEHALPDCAPFHGAEGRRDLFGYGYDQSGDVDVNVLLPAFISGRLSEFNHHTAGYPVFTTWPSAPFSSTHQTQYWRWIERAWMGGLRLVVLHATTNSVICELLTGENIQRARYSCNDMVAVDRIIEEAGNLERYIDAQAGGPGRGFFRIVRTPAEARAVIEEGRLAVVLGIETSNLFDCFSVPRPGMPTCDADYVRSQLDRYHALGIRVMFPVHKFDNAFSAGDGNRSFIELGNFVNSGHWSSFTDDCPDVHSVFDHGPVQFGGLNMPREEYLSPPPNDMSGFPEAPVSTVAPFIDRVLSPALEGDHCQSHGLTPLGELLLNEMMDRGMLIEVDHLPRRAFVRAYEILEAADYPAVGTHGNNNAGRIYAIGGVSSTGLGRCADPSRPSAMTDGLRARVERIRELGGYPAEGFSFDLNGFAGGPRPRFGERSPCSTPQTNPITYPFTSYAGDVTFTEPRAGERVFDFNTEGMSHIGLLPELVEDARRGGSTDEDLEPLFRSAEGYLRMWERAEARAATRR